jgi:hypothetical protein
METLINYKLSDFLKLNNEIELQSYLVILDLLKPLKTISNPKYKWYNKQPKNLLIKSIKALSFGEVTEIRNNFNEGSIDSVLESVKMVVDVSDKEILNFTILTFYGIISYMKSELNEITNMEINELTDESFDINVEAVNAKERMGKYGILNTIDSLAKEDVLKWELIEKLPYMTVFTKMCIDNEKNKIQQEINELRMKKQKQN